MQGLYEGYTVYPDRGGVMEHLYTVSDVYSPWRNVGSLPNEAPLRNSDMIPEDQNCRSCTPHVVREGLTEIEFKLKCLMGIEATWTAPRSIFHMHL